MHYERCTSCKSSREVSAPLLQGIVPWVCDSLPLFNRNRMKQNGLMSSFWHALSLKERVWFKEYDP